MPSFDAVIVESVETILDAQCRPDVVQAAEQKWPASLWQTIEVAGLANAWVPESLGGAGATWGDGLAIIQSAARHAAPLPLAETLLVNWVLSDRALAPPGGPLGLALAGRHDFVEVDTAGKLNGRVSRCAFARHLQAVLVALERNGSPGLALVDRADFQVEADSSLAGEPSDTVVFDGAAPRLLAGAGQWTVDALTRLGATVRCFQISGALEHLLERTTGYAKDRTQFGRPIAKFQAVQHNLAVLAGEVAASGMAAHSAADAIARCGINDDRAFLAVASAKIRCGQAATEGASIAHQVHGAMGFAREYPLHLHTRRLWSWRDEFGVESEWAEALGKRVLANGAEGFWPMLTST